MSKSQNSQANTLSFSGTPAEVGGQIWRQLCLPAIMQTSNNSPPEALAQLYIGFLSAAMGSMAADFGHAGALDGFRMTVDSFEVMADELQGTRIQ